MNMTVYLDCNATTIMPPVVIESVNRWMNRGNPSASYASATEAQAMMAQFRSRLASMSMIVPSEWRLVFTSGASESNSHILTASARAYRRKTKAKPHIVSSVAEHKSVLICLKQLEDDDMAEVTLLPIEQSPLLGTVRPADLAKAIKPNTCLVSIMAANNETGIVNDIPSLAKEAHAKGVPFHTDAVQMFGKAPGIIGPVVDAFSVSFHKLYGPPGVGLLAVRKDFVERFGLCSLICGTQNEGMRGGTENIPGIGGALAAVKYAAAGRAAKNEMMKQLRRDICARVSAQMPTAYFQDYVARRDELFAKAVGTADRPGHPMVVWVAPEDLKRTVPNTILLAVVQRKFCNKMAKKLLEGRRIIVSVGSACNTKDPKASHVLDSIGAPPEIKSGTLRVSVCDTTTQAEVFAFVDALLNIVRSGQAVER